MSTPNCLPFMVPELTFCFLTSILLYVTSLCKICHSSLLFPPLKKRKKNLSTSFKTRHYFGGFLNFPFCHLPEVAHFSHMLFIYLRSIYFTTLCLPHRLCELFKCRVTISNFTRVASAPTS